MTASNKSLHLNAKLKARISPAQLCHPFPVLCAVPQKSDIVLQYIFIYEQYVVQGGELYSSCSFAE